MKPCFSTLGCPDWSVDKILASVRELGFAGIEIRGLEGEMFLPDSPHLQPGSDFLRGLSEAGCEVAVLGSSASFAGGQAALEECNAYAEAAAAIDCRIVRMFGGSLPEGLDHQQAAQQLVAPLREACEFAEARGVTLGLETHDAWCRGDECAIILEAVAHPALAIVWDTHHSYRHQEAFSDTVAAIGDRIVHVHLKDGFAPEGKAQYTLFGEGDIPLRELLETLSDRDYQGFLSLEWEKKWHPDLPEPEVAFPQFRSKLDDLLAQPT